MTRPRPPHDDGQRVTVGWREYVALPEWNVAHIKAKVDTGARTSALDVANLIELDARHVRFDIVVDRRFPDERTRIDAPIVRRTRVKSSFGASHDRLIVRARMRLGPVEKTIEMSLSCRKNMLCRMLLGRAALDPEFVVDPAHRYLHGLRPRRVAAASTRKPARSSGGASRPRHS